MKILVFPSGPFSTNAYLVYCPKSLEACVIDPAPESGKKILEVIDIENLRVQGIWLTHSHWDHFGDLAYLKEKLDVPVYIHEKDADNLKMPGADGLPVFIEITPCPATHYVNDGDYLSLADAKFLVIHTPGHSPGGVCYYCEKEKLLFSGDTLFKGSIGNISFPTSNADQMWKSLEKLVKLPQDTRFYPGHGDSSTIGEETWLPYAKEHFS